MLRAFAIAGILLVIVVGADSPAQAQCSPGQLFCTPPASTYTPLQPLPPQHPSALAVQDLERRRESDRQREQQSIDRVMDAHPGNRPSPGATCYGTACR